MWISVYVKIDIRIYTPKYPIPPVVFKEDARNQSLLSLHGGFSILVTKTEKFFIN